MAIRKVDEIIECHLVSGGYDQMLKFVTRNVMQYQEIKTIFVKQHYPLVKFFAAHD